MVLAAVLATTVLKLQASSVRSARPVATAQFIAVAMGIPAPMVPTVSVAVTSATLVRIVIISAQIKEIAMGMV